MHIDDLARVAYEAIRALCQTQGVFGDPAWTCATPAERSVVVDAVRFRLQHPGGPVSLRHEGWMRLRTREGWKHGPVVDKWLKTHPLLVPFDQLPVRERAKEALFASIVDGLRPHLETP
jgi:hypothetical protein